MAEWVGASRAELAVRYVYAWAVHRAGQIAGAADETVSQAPDGGLARVHALVTDHLQGERALTRALEEAAAGNAELSRQSRQFLLLAIEDAVVGDAAFAQALKEAVAAIAPPGTDSVSVRASSGGIAIGGSADVKAESGGVAALQVKDVTLEIAPREPGPPELSHPDRRFHAEQGDTFVNAANHSVAAVNVGEIHQHWHAPVPASVTWPHQVGSIPPRAGAFQDRAEGQWLREMVLGGGTVVLGQSGPAASTGQVLSGMGGVGKTQLAADHARIAWAAGELDLLVWVTAGDRSAVVTGLGQAGVAVAGAESHDLDAAAVAFLAWLEPKAGQAPCRWLVVVDDVADPADLTGLWPPLSPWGRTLVTTRRRDAALTHDGRRRIEVGLFSVAESQAYLDAVLAAQGRRESAMELANLAADLGCLPLALSQAAAFILDAEMTVADYRGLLADRNVALADASPQALPSGQARTMAAAWELSLERANVMRPVGLARPLLCLAAFLDPNGIPAAVLTAAPAPVYLCSSADIADTSLAGCAGESVTAADVVGGLRVLHRLSLIEHTPSDRCRTVRVHALVQRAVRDGLTTEEYGRTARAAADALIAAWPAVERDTSLAQSLRASANALANYAGAALYHPQTHPVLLQAGSSLGQSGQAAAAAAYHVHLASVIAGHLGPDHPDTLNARSNIAHWRGDAGDATGAAAAYTDLLHDLVRVLGSDHPRTLANRHNLARWREKAGDPAGAAEAFAELLADRLRVQGPDHPRTLLTRNNLAWSRGMAGDVAEAAEAFAGLLPDIIRVHGPDHPRTLLTRNNLAWWQGKSGDTAGAASAYADLLEDMVRVLGPQHPDTAEARKNLAHWQKQCAGPDTTA